MTKYNISQEEKEMLEAVAAVMRWEQSQLKILIYAYKCIKIQGCASRMDIMQLASLGIPIFVTLSAMGTIKTSDIGKQLNDGTISYEEIKQAFISMTSKDMVFQNFNSKFLKNHGVRKVFNH